MQLKNFITPIFAATGWLLTIILAMNLMGGTFDTRSCTTECTLAIYGAALVIAIVGLIIGLSRLRQTRDAMTITSTLSLVGLLGVFITVMFVGTFL